MVLDPLLPPQTSPRLFQFLPSRSNLDISEIPLILTPTPPWLAWEQSWIVPRKSCGMGLLSLNCPWDSSTFTPAPLLPCWQGCTTAGFPSCASLLLPVGLLSAAVC